MLMTKVVLRQIVLILMLNIFICAFYYCLLKIYILIYSNVGVLPKDTPEVVGFIGRVLSRSGTKVQGI
jgi:hypothetical protein